MKILKYAVIAVLFFAFVIGLFRGDGGNMYRTMQLIEDPDFSQGFIVKGQNGADQGHFDYGKDGLNPVWHIAQWNSGPCLWQDRIESDCTTITDGMTKTAVFHENEKSLSFHLNTVSYYNGKGGTTEKWPHLLAEQIFSVNAGTPAETLDFYSASAKKIIVSMDIRMTSYSFTDIEGVNAAQFLSYYYLYSKTGDDFVWFGVPLFDSRGETGVYYAIDTAGSNRMIYSIPSRDTYKKSPASLLNKDGSPNVSDEWIHVEVDICPHLKKLFKKGLADGTFKYAKTLDDLYIGGLNIGWEIIGSFDASVDIRNFRITSYIV